MATPNPQTNQTQKPQPQQGQAPYAPEKQSPTNPNPNKGELMGEKKQNLDSSQGRAQYAADDINDVDDLDDDFAGTDIEDETPEKDINSQTNQAQR